MLIFGLTLKFNNGIIAQKIRRKLWQIKLWTKLLHTAKTRDIFSQEAKFMGGWQTLGTMALLELNLKTTSKKFGRKNLFKDAKIHMELTLQF